jgi:hypothetical protein
MDHRRVAGCALLSLALAACDIPTDTPIVEQRWIIPAQNTSVAVSQLLPAGVTISGAQFAVNVPATTAGQSLGQVCPGCQALNGQTVPAPPFTTTMSSTASLPASVTGATLTSGNVTLAVTNGFSFDPTAGGGSVTMTIRDGAAGRVLGTATIASGSLPAGQTITRVVAASPGGVGATISATTVIDSRGGQQATINTNQQISVTATPQSILVSAATVNVAGRSVSFSAQDLDVGDISDDVVGRIQQGAIILDITNPFNVAMTLQASIAWPEQGGQPSGTLTRSVAIGSGATSTVQLAFTGEELKRFLGKEKVTLSGSGSVSGAAGAITVTPSQQVLVKARIDLTLRIG